MPNPTDETTPRARILVIEDEVSIRRGLCDVLAFNGFEPEGVERGDDGLDRALAREHDLILLDVMLPGLDGFAICERIRSTDDQRPILMLTARGQEEDILSGFRSGADDYVTKPFSIAELMARTEALLKRTGHISPTEATPEPFDLGPWQIDPTEGIARTDDCEIDLTKREVEVLIALRASQGRIVSRRNLLHEVWGYPDPDRVETRTVDMHVAKLRKKLDQVTRGGSLIETVRGEGYRVRQ